MSPASSLARDSRSKSPFLSETEVVEEDGFEVMPLRWRGLTCIRKFSLPLDTGGGTHALRDFDEPKLQRWVLADGFNVQAVDGLGFGEDEALGRGPGAATAGNWHLLCNRPTKALTAAFPSLSVPHPLTMTTRKRTRMMTIHCRLPERSCWPA
jgi:hypothetical protein